MKYKIEGNAPLNHDTWLPSEVLERFENMDFEKWEEAQNELFRLLKIHETYEDPNNDPHGRFGPFATENYGELDLMEFMDEALENYNELMVSTTNKR